jgi:glycosyltransferase involved in cell wall biosynthesis
VIKLPSENKLRLATVIASLNAGGIGTVCRYAAQGIACSTDWQVTLLCLHDPPGEQVDEASGLRTVGLGLDGNCPRLFLNWLNQNPQDLLISSDVCTIEPAFPYLPMSVRHVIQVHDSMRRYRAVAVRNAAWIQGVTCVGKHIEGPLHRELKVAGFSGLLRAVHNGASFPPLRKRRLHNQPLRLLFIGRVEPLKGVFDFIPLMQRLKKIGIPVTLNIVGGDNPEMRSQFKRKALEDRVRWSGRVPHEQCYEIAAASDVFLMTSRKEPFGMVTIEAMSMGCVPIAYDIPSGSKEIIEHEKSGLLVPNGNIRIWADYISRLHQDRQYLKTLSNGAVQRARNHFDAETMARNLRKFLTDVLEHSKSHSILRKEGLPLQTPDVYTAKRKGYQRLPAGWRRKIGKLICSNAKLSSLILNR